MDVGDLEAVSRYRLPNDVWRTVSNRYPFSGYSLETLASAAHEVIRSPERRGMFPHVVRKIIGIEENDATGRWTILEAHLNSVEIDDAAKDFLLLMGFEEDGLFEAVPPRYSGHFTLKYKFGEKDSVGKRSCYSSLIVACNQIIEYFEREKPDLEYNLEIEVYNSCHRRSWSDPNAKIWPSNASGLEVMHSANSLSILPSGTGHSKRADVHAKLSREINGDVSDSIKALLGSMGFYSVVTWSGNTVMTGQFVSVSTAKEFFKVISNFAEAYRGVAELTLEPTPFFFRSSFRRDGILELAEIPPLISVMSKES